MIRQRPAPGLLYHSGRGVQYAYEDYRKVLASAQITSSISRQSDHLDDAQ